METSSGLRSVLDTCFSGVNITSPMIVCDIGGGVDGERVSPTLGVVGLGEREGVVGGVFLLRSSISKR